jgi:L-lactate dehydrogenase complex protein LldG
MVGTQAMSDARARVLSAVSQALADLRGRELQQPAVTTIPDSAVHEPDLAGRFTAELKALSGDAMVVRDRAECAEALASYLRARGVRSVAVQSRPLAQGVATLLDGFDVASAADQDMHALERFDCAVLEGASLLADTGSSIVLLDSAADRVLPYLPRTCAIVAPSASLHAVMSAQALACIWDAANAGARGEALIVAGPSRSADIEKTLVLGAHGPQALAVFIIQNP